MREATIVQLLARPPTIRGRGFQGPTSLSLALPLRSLVEELQSPFKAHRRPAHHGYALKDLSGSDPLDLVSGPQAEPID